MNHMNFHEVVFTSMLNGVLIKKALFKKILF